MRQTKRTNYQLGPSFRTQGGISSVLYTYRVHLSGRLNMKFIPTYSGRSRIKDLAFFLYALVRVLFINLSGEKALFQIHTSTYGSYIRKSILARLCLLFRKPVVLHIHGADFDRFIEEESWQPGVVSLLNRVDRLVVLSESWKQYLSKYVSPEKITVIYNPIRETRQAYVEPPSGGAAKILFMGRLGQRKGTYDLLEAVRRLADEEFVLDLYGDGENEKVKGLVKGYGLEKHIKVHGWVPHSEVTGIYDSSDVLVLPSYSEGLPMSVIEGMGRGLPIIASDVGGIPEALEDGDNGFVVRPGDVDKLAERLKSLITDPGLRKEMGKRSLEKARAKFSAERVGAQLEKLYAEIP